MICPKGSIKSPMATAGALSERFVDVYCGRCSDRGRLEPLLELAVLEDERVWVLAPGKRTGTRNVADRIANGKQLLADGVALGRYGISRNPTTRGGNGAIVVACQRCGLKFPHLGRARLDRDARDAASKGVARMSMTAQGRLIPDAPMRRASGRI